MFLAWKQSRAASGHSTNHRGSQFLFGPVSTGVQTTESSLDSAVSFFHSLISLRIPNFYFCSTRDHWYAMLNAIESSLHSCPRNFVHSFDTSKFHFFIVIKNYLFANLAFRDGFLHRVSIKQESLRIYCMK